MKLNWDDRLATAVRRRLEELLECEQHEQEDLASIARRISALPVHLGWTGVLAINEIGEVVFYNYETAAVGPETDNRWIMIAGISAAGKYPELTSILPKRPALANDCPKCSRTGRVLTIKAICGECLGLGWVPC